MDPILTHDDACGRVCVTPLPFCVSLLAQLGLVKPTHYIITNTFISNLTFLVSAWSCHVALMTAQTKQPMLLSCKQHPNFRTHVSRRQSFRWTRSRPRNSKGVDLVDGLFEVMGCSLNQLLPGSSRSQFYVWVIYLMTCFALVAGKNCADHHCTWPCQHAV